MSPKPANLRAAHFDLYLAFKASELHLPWHKASVYLGHLEDPCTNTYCRAFSDGIVTTCSTTLVCSAWDSNNKRYACDTSKFRHDRHWRTFANVNIQEYSEGLMANLLRKKISSFDNIVLFPFMTLLAFSLHWISRGADPSVRELKKWLNCIQNKWQYT